MARHKRRGATTEQLRDDIDSGRTGDKVDFADPAAAPLGTDEEAAGTPPESSTVATARRIENASPSRPRHQLPLSVKLAGAALAVLAIALIIVAVS